MKKIVALVLSLVMVLGLATTAFGAPSTVKYDLYNADGTLMTAAATDWVNIESFKADVDKTTGAGNVAYYTMVSELGYPVGDYYVECARADADFYLTLKGNEGVYKYLDEVTDIDYFDAAVEVANIGDECGEFDLPATATKLYMATDADGVPSFWYGVTAGSVEVLVDGKIVEVESATAYYVGHDWVVTSYDAKENPATAKCDECDATAKLYKTKLAAPAGSVFDVAKVAGYWVVVDKAPAADTEKVESAQTFDAGIAMYVGMSVMAAAGSAVVLKKKD